MSEGISHNCGFSVAHTLHDVYSFTKALQSRGRDATGIAAIGDNRIDVVKWLGSVNRFDITDLHKILPRKFYHTYFGHVRYTTKGDKDKLLEEAHPHVVGGNLERRVDHIIISDCDAVIVHNGHVEKKYLEEIENSQLKTTCDSEALLHFFRRHGEHETLRRIPGAYTLAIADKKRKEVVVLRDSHGIRPGYLGMKDGAVCVASENISFRTSGVSLIGDLIPGFVYYLKPEGSFTKEKVISPYLKRCFFEWNYLANENSILDSGSVRIIREKLGEKLGDEFRPKADLVTFVPRCPEVAAKSYSERTGIPYEEIFYKVRGERSFQGINESERKISISGNLHLLPRSLEILPGKTIVVIDDSFVRGNVAERVRKLLYEEGKVEKAYLVSYTPPIGIMGKDGIERGCSFGVDMPPKSDNFLARGKTIEEISEKIRAPVYYLTSKGMFESFEKIGINPKTLCSYCIGGEHPFDNYISKNG